jgi:hypothetical protein
MSAELRASESRLTTLVSPAGLEPAASTFGRWRSIPLRYEDMRGGTWGRTRDAEATVLQTAERSVAHFRREDDGNRTRCGLAHNQPPRQSVRPQSIRQDSNLRPAGCGPAALAAELLIVKLSDI